MKIKNRNDGSLESKFEAYRLWSMGLSAIEIGKRIGKSRCTAYYRIYLIESWIRTYKDVKTKYEQYLKQHAGTN